MESILYNIINQVKTKLGNQITTIDEDYGQLENLDNETQDMYPITFPCVLVDAPSIAWSNIADGNQKGQVQVKVKLCIDCYDDTHYGSDTMEAILTRQALADDLHHALQTWHPDGECPLIRTDSTFYTSNHGIKVYETTYTMTCTDYVAPETLETSPTIKIKSARL